MVSSKSPHLEEFEQALARWTDERFVSREQVRALSMFSVYLVNLAEREGWEYDGHSFKVASPMSVLTVKATIDGVPQVVFTSGRTHTACVQHFIKKLEQGWLEWRADRYRS